MTCSTAAWLLLVMMLGHACTSPAPSVEAHPLGKVSELGQRLASHSLARDPGPADTRLGLPGLPGLPTTQDLAAIKKVAQILIMLGEQVIPSILGDGPQPAAAHAAGGTVLVEDPPNDTVDDN